jgi:hypothetical protein
MVMVYPLIFISEHIVTAILGSFGITNVVSGGQRTNVRHNLLSTEETFDGITILCTHRLVEISTMNMSELYIFQQHLI